MVDYHCHLLPGLDDGAADLAEALDMARALADFGFSEVCCTPHCVKGQHETSPVEVREAVQHLQRILDGAGVPLVLQPGMEYYLDGCFESFAANLLPLGESRLVLCEAPPQVRPEVVAAMLELIVVQGYIPLVAHPERSESVYRLLTIEAETPGETTSRPEHARVASTDQPRSLLGRLFAPRSSKTAGHSLAALPAKRETELPECCLYQANLGSFTGFYGAAPQRRAYELLQRGAYHCFASDLHDSRSAAAVLEPAREKLIFNPALQRLAAFAAPRGAGGSPQMAFW